MVGGLHKKTGLSPLPPPDSAPVLPHPNVKAHLHIRRKLCTKATFPESGEPRPPSPHSLPLARIRDMEKLNPLAKATGRWVEKNAWID